MVWRHSWIALLLAACAGLAALPTALAAGGGGGDSVAAPADPTYASALEAVGAKKFDAAIPLLKTYLERTPGDAHAHNWLAYSYRKTGSLDAAFLHYDKALTIDPKHRGAHAYLGEAYLMAGNLGKAEEHLRVLDGLCWLPCAEYTELKQAVAGYKSTGKVGGSK